MTGDEDYRNLDPSLRKFCLKIQTAQPWQPDIDDQAAYYVRPLRPKEFLRGIKRFDPQSYRSDKAAECPAHRRIVINDENDR
jgi:hypothetical protein